MQLSDSSILYRRTEKINPDGERTAALHQLHADEHLFRKPTLLCLGGARINQHFEPKDYKKAASGLAKLGHYLLGYKGFLTGYEAFDIVAAVYPESDTDLISYRISHNVRKMHPGDDRNPGIIAESVAAFVNQYIAPLVQEANGKIKSYDEVRAGFRNIHILAHSFGGVYAQLMGDMIVDYLKSVGFNDRQIKGITSQALLISAGSTHILGSGNASFSTLNIINRTDRTLCDKHRDISFPGMMDEMLEENGLFDRKRQLPSRTLTMLPVSFVQHNGKHKLAYNTDSLEHVLYAAQQHQYQPENPIMKEQAIDGRMLRSDAKGHFDGTPPPRDLAGHELLNYLHFGAGRHGFMLRMAASSVLVNSMNNAIENSHRGDSPFLPLPAMKQLVKAPVHHRYAVTRDWKEGEKFFTALCYNERMQEASSLACDTINNPKAR